MIYNIKNLEHFVYFCYKSEFQYIYIYKNFKIRTLTFFLPCEYCLQSDKCQLNAVVKEYEMELWQEHREKKFWRQFANAHKQAILNSAWLEQPINDP